ncbi:RTC4-like domain-containing protein [Myxozyma melibiosi]|uniref:Restriction of telomere capping protein 4 n=1 Tax=Myxozyma melibiosi TaxID=54550 RepID=A0ABR1FBA1_9ASCO
MAQGRDKSKLAIKSGDFYADSWSTSQSRDEVQKKREELARLRRAKASGAPAGKTSPLKRPHDTTESGKGQPPALGIGAFTHFQNTNNRATAGVSIKQLLDESRKSGRPAAAPSGVNDGVGPVLSRRLGAQPHATKISSSGVRDQAAKPRVVRSNDVSVEFTALPTSTTAPAAPVDSKLQFLKYLKARKNQMADQERRDGEAAGFTAKNTDDTDYKDAIPISESSSDLKILEASEDLETQTQATIRRLDSGRALSNCPLCDSPLSEAIRVKFGKFEDRVKRSYAICQAHKKEKVMELAAGRNYSTSLNESSLEKRARKAVAAIDLPAILNGEQHSVYHEHAKTAAQKHGRRLDALQQMEAGQGDMLPGYYGLVGNGVMLRVAMTACEKQIRAAAARERWISNLSVTGYVASVLVPEIAVRLIMEDQGCEKEAAEKIRKESIDYGRLMFGETLDLVSEEEEVFDHGKTEAKKVGTKKASKDKKKTSERRSKEVKEPKDKSEKGTRRKHLDVAARTSSRESSSDWLSSDVIELPSSPLVTPPAIRDREDVRDIEDIETTPRASQSTPVRPKRRTR